MSLCKVLYNSKIQKTYNNYKGLNVKEIRKKIGVDNLPIINRMKAHLYSFVEVPDKGVRPCQGFTCKSALHGINL